MDARKYISGNHLKAEDLKHPVRVTIARVQEEMVGKSDEDDGDRRMVVYFHGKEKGVSMNKTNIETMAYLTGTYDTDQWLGREVELFNDTSVMFAGKRVGGIRFRTPATSTGQWAPAPAVAGLGQWPPPVPPVIAPPAPVTDDDIPF